MTVTENHLELELKLEEEATACLVNKTRVIKVAMASVYDIGITDDDPRSLAEAMNQPDWLEWKTAMDKELALMVK